ncbi:hypothetical protein [Aquiflexum lacus]|uniref:hypothetical protein n=1 Tax=Aquiflexum lacus TaxID=2483805 RepID=UPI001894A2A7|nr:hypothetical protein [Aquiflexum lacus]
MQQLTRIFNNREEFKSALNSLLAKGYQYDEIKINRREGKKAKKKTWFNIRIPGMLL